MILQNKSLIAFAGLAVSTALSAGGISGSGPPSRQALEEMLSSASSSFQTAGLFEDESGSVRLGVNAELAPSLKISKNLNTQSLIVSPDSFDYLDSHKEGIIEATDLKSKSLVPAETVFVDRRSYRIEDGDKLGELHLVDRRAAARAAVAK